MEDDGPPRPGCVRVRGLHGWIVAEWGTWQNRAWAARNGKSASKSRPSVTFSPWFTVPRPPSNNGGAHVWTLPTVVGRATASQPLACVGVSRLLQC